MVEGISNGYNLIPQDWKDLFRMLLTPAQYIVWNAEYQTEAIHAGNNSGGLYIPDQLYGVGAFTTIQQQATGTPPPAYSVIGRCVIKAFKRVPVSGKPSKSFAAIRQNAGETYSDFIDRLQEAIQRQVDNEEASGELMKRLAYEHANADCHCALQSIVNRGDYTLADMLKACADIDTNVHQMDALTAALQKGKFGKPKGTKGIFVIPGVIDSDYEGILMIQFEINVPMTLKQGDSWAQLVIVPYVVPAGVWQSTTPVWIEQWPLTQEKLIALHELVREQLAANHIEPTTSPFNTPVFVIKKKSESGLFGVPLLVLLEYDQKRIPGIRTPFIFQKLISQIEGGKLETEGLLRIPGVAARVKNLCQELESKFYEGTFNWDSVKQHDAASLLKLFIRELPQPLFTVEYLKAFQDVQKLPTKKHQLQALNLLVLLLPEGNRDTLKVLLEFLQRVIDHGDKNKMNLKNVAMVMAPNLFMFHGLGAKPTEQSEFVMAAGTANVMRFMIKYQNLLWTIPTFLVNQVRKQNAESQKKERKDKAMRKLLKKMAYDREKHEKQDKSISDQKSGNDADIPEGVIRVQAPHLSKVSMAIQLTGELKAGDIVARFLSQKSGTVQSLKKEELFLHEVGGNIGERCLDDDTFMKNLYQLNPNAEWIIKSRNG
ncbi:PREDICTED: rho GTPase-activating protein 18-like [Thamnophis sirtalis]|uniref:Rho GTPase-activating protein 18-like n=1 Tax=Thamnophis sirtalis TaxID=35019 RepID=A0A6I9YB21_9SAUR|nr:PREDICTED: rho GTPase-activating protein 18-like [Thamnophis sirtalis]